MIDRKNTQKLYNLPSTVAYCKECVVSNQRPRIGFDGNGVCNACNYTKQKKNAIDWLERDEQLKELLARHRRSDGSFDVVVPSSGGKDSARVAHELKYNYGMNPLTVTWAPHVYTDIGYSNFQSMIHSGFTNILGTPDGQVHRKLTSISFKELGDPFQPFIYGQKFFPLQIAVAYGIPLIMDGENAEAEYGGDEDTTKMSGFDQDQSVKYHFSNTPVEAWKEYGFTDNDLHVYKPPPIDKVASSKIERAFFSYYKKWIPQENYYYASEYTGFETNPDGRSEGTYSKYASLDDRLDGFHYYLMFIKFGIGRATSDAGHEIRDGHISREEGVALVKRYDGEFPQKHFQEFLDYCDITEDTFWQVIDSWRSPHLWSKSQNDWQLLHQVS